MTRYRDCTVCDWCRGQVGTSRDDYLLAHGWVREGHCDYCPSCVKRLDMQPKCTARGPME